MRLSRIGSSDRYGRGAGMTSPVLIAQSALHGVLTSFFAAIALISLGALIVGHYSRKETVPGEVVARDGFTATVSEKAGTISSVAVRLGDHVEAGQLLAVIQIPRVVAGAGDTAELTIRRLDEMRNNLETRGRALRAALGRAPQQIDLVNRNTDNSLRSAAATRAAILKQRSVATERLGAVQTLGTKGFASRSVIAQVENAALQVDQALANADLAASEIERARTDRLLSINTEMRSLDQALLDVENQKIQVDTQIHDLQSQEFVRVTAPASGEVRAISIRQGQRVDPGDRLFALARPGSKLAIALEVPSNAIGFIEPGQRVVLKYDAFPFETFGVRYGQVSAVQSAAMTSTAQPSDAKAGSGKTFSVEVLPDQAFVSAYGQRRPLKIGMSVTAEVTLERRRLISWLLEPLYSVQRQLR